MTILRGLLAEALSLEGFQGKVAALFEEAAQPSLDAQAVETEYTDADYIMPPIEGSQIFGISDSATSSPLASDVDAALDVLYGGGFADPDVDDD